MIEYANLTEEQERLIKYASQKQIESLNRLLLFPGHVSGSLTLKGYTQITEDKVEWVIKNQIGQWEKLQEDPQTLLKLDEKNLEVMQFILAEFFDNYDGDPIINGIWSKILKLNEFKKSITSIN